MRLGACQGDGGFDMVSARRLKREKKVEEAIKTLQRYWNTYSDQDFYRGYRDETIIDDALYAIGLALWGNVYATGFDVTRQKLLEHLQKWRDEQNAHRLKERYEAAKRAGV